ncbi:MAG: Helix-turn-helix domain, partial [Chloroflexota bacterium]
MGAMGDTRLIQAARRRHRGTLRVLVDELRGLREDAGLSQAAVARAATISPSYLSEIEAGRTSPTLETLHALA